MSSALHLVLSDAQTRRLKELEEYDVEKEEGIELPKDCKFGVAIPALRQILSALNQKCQQSSNQQYAPYGTISCDELSSDVSWNLNKGSVVLWVNAIDDSDWSAKVFLVSVPYRPEQFRYTASDGTEILAKKLYELLYELL